MNEAINYNHIRKTISIPILLVNISDEVKNDFFFKNINRYRYLKNECVELANLYCGEYNLYDDISLYKLQYYYHNYIEIYDENYSEYCNNMSECVFKDIESSIRSIRKKNRDILNGKIKGCSLGKLKFKKRDNYYGAFKINPKMSSKKDKNGNLKQRGRICFLNDYNIRFMIRSSKGYQDDGKYVYLNLKSPLFNSTIEETNKDTTYIRHLGNNNECWFTLNDIKYISFIHKLDKFYIQFTIEADIFTEKVIRKPKAGIDLGIHNPGILYDGDKFIRISMPNKIIQKLLYLERRAGRYKSIMNRKYFTNKELVKCGVMESPYSKNYEKIRKKYRRVENKMHNIKMDWIYKSSKKIVIKYDKIIVDKSHVPIMNDLPKKVARRVMHKINLQAIGEFNIILQHMSEKYKSLYIEAPTGTTCKCSDCGHINKPIPLHTRTFICENCGLSLDRDLNASKNCYNSY